MTAPTRKVRELTYTRDNHTCVSCGATEPLEWNHRESSGHGGRGTKATPVTAADGVTACHTCNSRFEADLQGEALRFGWKIRRNRIIAAHEIPYFDYSAMEWYVPDVVGGRGWVPDHLAYGLLAAAGNLTRMEMT
jgi:hypothetical protein